jgi:4-hydroxybenzoate polyprenyltransferase
LIAAGGYVINNILDQKTDAINKPNNVIIGKNISETNALPLYGTYGCWRSNWFYLSNVILKPSFAAVFYFDRCHSILYATSLKQILIVGNTIVAILLSCSVIIIGILTYYPIDAGNNK